MTDMSDQHRQFEELLPWYLNGTLGREERQIFEAHLKACLPCNAALRQERRLRESMQAQDDVPLGPEHGIRDLIGRIDRQGPAHPKVWARSRAIAGYGLAASLGALFVWLILSSPGEPPGQETEFATLASVSGSPVGSIDLIFVEQPSSDQLSAFLDEIDATLVGGPSELGRYTIAIDSEAAEELDAVLESLAMDPRIAFAGPSFSTASDDTGERR